MFYGNVFSKLKNNNLDIWKKYVNHEFVVKLSESTLKKEFFLDYLVQDYLFLIQFSKAWSLAVVKADNLEEMKISARTVNALINFEMDLHVKLCNSYMISQKQLENAEEKNQNIAYTRYVLEKGYSGDFLDLIVALAPCVLGYGEIGKNLKNCIPKNEMYRKWIETYSGDEYQNICEEMGKLLDNAVILRLGNNFENTYKWEKIKKNFKITTLLEIDFWEMSLK